MNLRNLALVALAIAFIGPTCARGGDAPASLGAYAVQADRVTVSGLSSGGYMAVQLAVAYSSVFSGVGVIAAGPFGCAYTGSGTAADINRALGPCMTGGYGWVQRWQCMMFLATCAGNDYPDAEASIRLTQRMAERHAIDPVAAIRRQRVYLLSGKQDSKVVPAVVDALQRFYAAFAEPANIGYDHLDRAAHTFPTEGFVGGNACSRSSSPYVSDCSYDSAGKLLNQLYGSLKARNDSAPRGSLVEFDQAKFFPAGSDAGMAPTGHAYVPNTCRDGTERCSLHIALHGCRQTVAEIGKSFIEGAGYNRWADTNDIIVLYPQVRAAANAFDRNPENCWDWWGYTGAAWLEKRAPQMQAIAAMVNHLKSR